MNVTAGVGAFILAWVDDYIGSKKTIIVSLISLLILGVPILFLHNKTLFWIFALSLSLFVGPVQSASRSFMAHLITDKNISAEMFGLYALSGKVTAFIGPWILGTLTLAFGTQRAGMATVLVFFAVGGIMLLFVRQPK